MPTPTHAEFRLTSHTRKIFKFHYFALLLFSLHWAGVLYINSSYIGQFVSGRMVNILYIIGSLVTIIVFLNASPLLTHFGNISFIISLTVTEFIVLTGMAFSQSATLAALLFIFHQAIVPLILFGLDILMETDVGTHEETTGQSRGVILTIIALAYALGPFLSGMLIGSASPNFTYVYLASAFLLIPFAFLIRIHGRNLFHDPIYSHLKIKEGLAIFAKHNDLRNVFFAHFLLQFFFTWMIIYTPVYLNTVIGLDWEAITNILTAGLLAYVILEYLIGYIADTHLGEKEMMAFGFLITAVSTSWFVFLDDSSVFVWMFIMFMTRVGASFIETTTESYFFKHTAGKDTDVIGLFRITRPLSYVVGAGMGGLMLHLFAFEFLFVILGILMLPGFFFAMALKDTR